MDKSNLELFKQAISEGVSNRFDKMVAECTEEIAYSDKHNLAMQTIVYGKADTKRTLSPKAKRLIAILVAAALVLTSCGIIFRNEIREMFEEFFVMLSYNGNETDIIEEVYELRYLPEGYSLNVENIRPMGAQYKFINENGDYIWFEQKLIDVTDLFVDNEEGYSRINEISNYEIYYRYANENHVYVWNDAKYSMFIRSNLKLSTHEIILILEGLTNK